MSELVSTNWVYKNLNNRKLVILDCSWHMPYEKVNAKKKYEKRYVYKKIGRYLFKRFI